MTAGQRIEVFHEVRMTISTIVIPLAGTAAVVAVAFKDQIVGHVNRKRAEKNIRKMMK